MHGGAFGSGAPTGNRNALKSGLYTRQAVQERRQMRDLLRQCRELIRAIKLNAVEPEKILTLRAAVQTLGRPRAPR